MQNAAKIRSANAWIDTPLAIPLGWADTLGDQVRPRSVDVEEWNWAGLPVKWNHADVRVPSSSCTRECWPACWYKGSMLFTWTPTVQ
jgi:hypothetical protein